MVHETKVKHNEKYLGEQKNVGVNTMENTALNKSEPVAKGLELVGGTNGSQRKPKKPRRKTKQNRWRSPGKSAWIKRKSIGRQTKPRRKTKKSRRRRPGTSARNKRKSIKSQRKPRQLAGKGLELVRGTKIKIMLRWISRKENRLEGIATGRKMHQQKILCVEEKRENSTKVCAEVKKWIVGKNHTFNRHSQIVIASLLHPKLLVSFSRIQFPHYGCMRARHCGLAKRHSQANQYFPL